MHTNTDNNAFFPLWQEAFAAVHLPQLCAAFGGRGVISADPEDAASAWVDAAVPTGVGPGAHYWGV
jgi:hypothetical protein